MAGSPTNRVRKPYVVSKAREPWRKEEHERFLEALDKFGRNWKQIVDHVGTRSVQQIRSHAQKFFLKLEKEGQQEDIPPPRPKKRPARPYPHKQQASSGAKSKRMRSAAAEDASEPKPSSSGGSSDAGTRSKLTKLDEQELAVGLGLLTDAAKAEEEEEPAAASPMTTRAARKERVASGELEGAAGLLPLEAAAKAGGLNWSELYAIVGSLFETNMSVPQHLAMLDHLPREQRELLLSMLGTLKSNLRETVRQQQSAASSALGLRPPPLGSAPYPPADMTAPAEQYAFLA